MKLEAQPAWVCEKIRDSNRGYLDSEDGVQCAWATNRVCANVKKKFEPQVTPTAPAWATSAPRWSALGLWALPAARPDAQGG